MNFWSKIDVIFAGVLLIVSVAFFTQLLGGCSHIGSKKLRKIDVDCKQCEVKIMYDLSDDDKHLDIKGL